MRFFKISASFSAVSKQASDASHKLEQILDEMEHQTSEFMNNRVSTIKLNRYIVVVLLSFLLSACADRSTPMYAIYDAEFNDSSKIEQIEVRIRAIAKKYKLTVLEKDRKEMSLVIIDEQPAFFIFLDFNGRTVLTVGNAGVGTILSIAARDYGVMPINRIDELLAEVISNLSELGLEFKKVESKQPTGEQ